MALHLQTTSGHQFLSCKFHYCELYLYSYSKIHQAYTDAYFCHLVYLMESDFETSQ